MATKQCSRVPVGPVAAGGLCCLAVTLALRTSWLLLGPLQPQYSRNVNAHARDTAAYQGAVDRFCAPGLAGKGGGRNGPSDTIPRHAIREGKPFWRASQSSYHTGVPEAVAQTAPTWEDIDALISRPAAVHGRQIKAGLPAHYRQAMSHMVNLDKWMKPGLPPSITPDIAAWLNLSASWDSSRGTSAELRSPVPSCHYLVEHSYRAIFVRTTKIGGTALSNVLGFANHPVACRMGPERCKESCKGRPMCLTYMTDPEEVERVWKNYTVFAFVRNPWARAVSSFHFNNRRAIRQRCQTHFTRFAEAPSMQGLLCYQKFDTCCRERYGFVLEHVEPQTPFCLFTEEGLPAVDYIGRSERFDEDFQELIDILNSRRPPGTPFLNITRVARLNTGIQKSEWGRRRVYAQHYENNSALCDVHRYYREDFRLLKFDSELDA